jgi:hypothetical protein
MADRLCGFGVNEIKNTFYYVDITLLLLVLNDVLYFLPAKTFASNPST